MVFIYCHIAITNCIKCRKSLAYSLLINQNLFPQEEISVATATNQVQKKKKNAHFIISALFLLHFFKYFLKLQELPAFLFNWVIHVTPTSGNSIIYNRVMIHRFGIFSVTLHDSQEVGFKINS